MRILFRGMPSCSACVRKAARLIVPAALLGAALCLAACGSREAASTAPAAPLSATGADSPQSLIPGLPAPRDIPRQAASLPPRFYCQAKYKSGLMPHQRTDEIDGKQLSQNFTELSFEPLYGGEHGQTHAGLSYAGYEFMTLGQVNGSKTLSLGWYREPLEPEEDFWIGLADFANNRWRWLRGPLPGSPLDISQHYDNCVNEQGFMYVMLLFTGDDAPTLSWLRLGDPLISVTLKAEPASAESLLQTELLAYIDSFGVEVTGIHFDFDSDGLLDETYTSYSIQHSYEELGQHRATVHVHTAEGVGATASCDLTVIDPANQGPTAILFALPSSGTAPLEVTLDAEDSIDNDGGQLIKVEWDLDGDGHYELNTGPELSTSTTLVRAGLNQIAVRVTDEDLASSSGFASVVVEGGWTPQPLPASGFAFRKLSLAMVGPQNTRRPGLVYEHEATSAIRYMGAKNVAGTAWNAPQLLHLADATQSWPDLENVDGRPAAVFTMVEAGEVKGMYIRANDDYGAAWPEAEQFLDERARWLDLAVVDGHPAAVALPYETDDVWYTRALDSAGSDWAEAVLVCARGESHEQACPLLQCFPGEAPRVFFGRRSFLGEYGTFFCEASDTSGSSFGERQKLSTLFMRAGELGGNEQHSMLLLRENWNYGGVYFQYEPQNAPPWNPALELDADQASGEGLSLLLYQNRPLALYLRPSDNAAGNDLIMRWADNLTGDSWSGELIVDGSGGLGQELDALLAAGKPLAVYEGPDGLIASAWD